MTRKLEELTIATRMGETLGSLDTEAPNDFWVYLHRIESSRHQLEELRYAHQKIVDSGQDPVDDTQEKDCMADLTAQLALLTEAINKHALTPIQADRSVSLSNDKQVREAHDKARRTAECMRLALLEDIKATGRRSSEVLRRIVWWMGGVSLVWVLGVAATVLYYFRIRICAPACEVPVEINPK